MDVSVTPVFHPVDWSQSFIRPNQFVPDSGTLPTTDPSRPGTDRDLGPGPVRTGTGAEPPGVRAASSLRCAEPRQPVPRSPSSTRGPPAPRERSERQAREAAPGFSGERMKMDEGMAWMQQNPTGEDCGRLFRQLDYRPLDPSAVITPFPSQWEAQRLQRENT